MTAVLSIRNVDKRFGGVVALDNCSLAVEQGTITALIGPNGSGKTTLFDVISQLIDEDGGTIIFAGHDITKHSPFSAHKVAKLGISRTFQDVRLFGNLTVEQHLLLALSNDCMSVPRNLLAGNAVDDAERRVIREALALVQFEKPPNTVVADLSYGQRKLLDLAIAIVKPHSLLLLDEPVAGVNPKIRSIIKDLLITLRKRGETILLIEHDMNFTMSLADYVYVLDAGKVIAQGKPSHVRKNRRVLEAYLGS